MTLGELMDLAAQHGFSISPASPLSAAITTAFELGAKLEREACAKICDEVSNSHSDQSDAIVAADKIRARGLD